MNYDAGGGDAPDGRGAWPCVAGRRDDSRDLRRQPIQYPFHPVWPLTPPAARRLVRGWCQSADIGQHGRYKYGPATRAGARGWRSRTSTGCRRTSRWTSTCRSPAPASWTWEMPTAFPARSKTSQKLSSSASRITHIIRNPKGLRLTIHR